MTDLQKSFFAVFRNSDLRRYIFSFNVTDKCDKHGWCCNPKKLKHWKQNDLHIWVKSGHKIAHFPFIHKTKVDFPLCFKYALLNQDTKSLAYLFDLFDKLEEKPKNNRKYHFPSFALETGNVEFWRFIIKHPILGCFPSCYECAHEIEKHNFLIGKLSPKTLDQICLSSNIQFRGDHMIQIIKSGNLHLAQKLIDDHIWQIPKRPSLDHAIHITKIYAYASILNKDDGELLSIKGKTYTSVMNWVLQNIGQTCVFHEKYHKTTQYSPTMCRDQIKHLFLKILREHFKVGNIKGCSNLLEWGYELCISNISPIFMTLYFDIDVSFANSYKELEIVKDTLDKWGPLYPRLKIIIILDNESSPERFDNYMKRGDFQDFANVVFRGFGIAAQKRMFRFGFLLFDAFCKRKEYVSDEYLPKYLKLPTSTNLNSLSTFERFIAYFLHSSLCHKWTDFASRIMKYMFQSHFENKINPFIQFKSIISEHFKKHSYIHRRSRKWIRRNLK